MKKLLLIFLTFISNTNASRKIEHKYQTCKANCQDGENNGGSCPSCINECQNLKCRAECYAHENGFKNSQECKDYQNCKINRQDPCDPEPCLNQAYRRKKCFEQCSLISDLAEIPTTDGNACNACNDCYCFNKFTYEYFGKAECKDEGTCSSCENRCSKKFAKYKDKLKSVCN